MRFLSAIVVCSALSLSGCNSSPSAGETSPLIAKLGKNCTVQFRRGEGLGAGGGTPVPPTTGAMNGAEVQVGGKLESVNNEWIVLVQGNQEYCIPRSSILLIEFRK